MVIGTQPLPEKLEEENQFNALIKNPTKTVSQVTRETKFKVKKEIYRNFDTVKGKYYLRSLIYEGTYKGKHAVLKFHGTEDVSHDADEIRNFESQNESKIIRAPFVYARRKWASKTGYGFTIFEYVEAPEIFSRPSPTKAQQKDFVRFYQEYRTKAITKPWIKLLNAKPDAVKERVVKYTQEWLKNAKIKKRLKRSDYSSYLSRFYALVPRYVAVMPMEFMHMHLYPEHIRKLSNGNYVLLDHVSWGYRPKWADLSYMLWRSILDIRSNSYPHSRFLRYVDEWINLCKTIPLTKRDDLFDKEIKFLILERTIGIIIGDLGSGRYWGTQGGRKYFKHMLALNQKLFEHLAEELET
ncbi:MAG: hypothetical protein KGH57_04075 [Candidatus Micrarchaeota archaeon]|nr:hypothetical protein [Candidatus Micrarchaeota archaeon]